MRKPARTLLIAVALAVAGFSIAHAMWARFPDAIWVHVPTVAEPWTGDFRYEPGGEALRRSYEVRRGWEVDDRLSAEPDEIRLTSTCPLLSLLGGRESITYLNPTPHVSVLTPHGSWWRFARQD